MSLPVFYVAREKLRVGERIVVAGQEGRHAAVVRRIRAGESIQLTDGEGQLARARVVAVDRSSITVDVLDGAQVPRPIPTLVVVQALPKGERGELAVELMTEIGVDVIIPWTASRCVVRWQGEREGRGLARWRSAAREAAKQSHRAWWPIVEPLTSTAGVVDRLAGAQSAFVLNEGATSSLAPSRIPTTGEVIVVVGPEGGVTDEETQQFIVSGAESVSVGPTVLRTSTAGLVAATVILSAGPRWSTS